MTPNTDQWLLNGDCDKCRKQKYCIKSCTTAKRRTESILNAKVHNRMVESLGVETTQKIEGAE